MMQIKRREGDQDRVRLTGLRIKGGLKTAKVAAQQMHEVCSGDWSQGGDGGKGGGGTKRLQEFLEKWGEKWAGHTAQE